MIRAVTNRTNWTTKQVTVNGADVNTSVSFTKLEKEKHTLTINAQGPYGGYMSCVWITVNGSEYRSIITGTNSTLVYQGKFEEGTTVTLTNFKSHIVYDSNLSYSEVMNIFNTTNNFGAIYIGGTPYKKGSTKIINMTSDQTISGTY